MSSASHRRSGPRRPDTPRRVRRGIKLNGGETPAIETWVGRRWLRLVEEAAPSDRFAQGLEYAQAGQTRSIETRVGGVDARVQGTAARAYETSIELEHFSDEQWEAIIRRLLEEGVVAAKVMAGGLPVNIEDVFGPERLALFPQGGEDVTPRCSCPDEQRWCKHCCCAAALIAERLEDDPFLIFQLRGLPIDELRDRLRRSRSVAESVHGAAPAYKPRPIPAAEAPAPPLSACLGSFWSAGPELDSIETTASKPEVTHALLRRLGPTPFEEARFPLVGLLATCYDVMSEAAVRWAAEAEALEVEGGEPSAEHEADADVAAEERAE